MLAFAGNSVLCRLALGEDNIDANTFTLVRLISGALGLYGIVSLRQILHKNRHQELKVQATISNSQNAQLPRTGGGFVWQNWLAPFSLFLYAVCFSFAYVQLDTGVGALVLFGSVQLSMITVSVYTKEHLPISKWLGVLVAFSGLCFLVWNQLDWGNTQVTLSGFVLMFIAGLAWAGYTLLGRNKSEPITLTYKNFVGSVAFCFPLCFLYYFVPYSLNNTGLLLALASGIISSAMGYAIWYVALNGLTRIQAGVVQLLVPVIASIGGLIWVNEAITLALVIAQCMILGGILLVMFEYKSTK